MNDTTLHVAFEVSEPLRRSINDYIDGIRAHPERCHLTELAALVSPFVEAVLGVFFKGPIDAAQMEGGSARLILGAMAIINQSSETLVNRFLQRTSVAEQRALAEHFESLRKYHDERFYVAFPLPETIPTVFAQHRAGDGDIDALLGAMLTINEAAIAHYMDSSVACLELGRFNRALVRAARATILKTSSSALERSLPAMEAGDRTAVVNYFDGMLMRF